MQFHETPAAFLLFLSSGRMAICLCISLDQSGAELLAERGWRNALAAEHRLTSSWSLQSSIFTSLSSPRIHSTLLHLEGAVSKAVF